MLRQDPYSIEGQKIEIIQHLITQPYSSFGKADPVQKTEVRIGCTRHTKQCKMGSPLDMPQIRIMFPSLPCMID